VRYTYKILRLVPGTILALRTRCLECRICKRDIGQERFTCHTKESFTMGLRELLGINEIFF
jgi:hypothetical protein